MTTATKQNGLVYLAVTIAVTFALTLGLVLALPAAAQDDSASRGFNCDATTVALVLAAQDAYGFTSSMDMGMMDGMMMQMGGGGSTDDSNDDAEGEDEGNEDNEDGEDDGNDEAEATEEAKIINTAKVTTVLAQDATEEPGDNEDDANEDDDEDDEDTESSGGMGAMMMMNGANCNALRDEATNFIFTTLGLPMGSSMGGDMGMAGAFNVMMSGPQEVPGPGDADGTGQGTVWIEGNEVCWNYTVAGITLPAVAAHIHEGPEGVAGPPVVPVTPADASGAAAGCTSEVSPDVIAAIQANPSGFYLNVHTTDFPDGAVRGQLLGGTGM